MKTRKWEYGVIPAYEKIADQVLARHSELTCKRAPQREMWDGVEQRIYSFPRKYQVRLFSQWLEDAIRDDVRGLWK